METLLSLASDAIGAYSFSLTRVMAFAITAATSLCF